MDHLFLTQWLVSALWWYEMGHERTENSEKQNFSMPVSFCSQPRLNRLQNHGERSITMLKHFQVNLKIFKIMKIYGRVRCTISLLFKLASYPQTLEKVENVENASNFEYFVLHGFATELRAVGCKMKLGLRSLAFRSFQHFHVSF